jgi:hypothetical protein
VDDGELAVTLELEQFNVRPIAGFRDAARTTVPVKPATMFTLTTIDLKVPESKVMFVGLSEIVKA